MKYMTLFTVLAPTESLKVVSLQECNTKIRQSHYTPGQAPEGSRRLRLPNFKTIGTRRWQGCQPYAPAAFTRRKYSWYSLLLEAGPTPAP